MSKELKALRTILYYDTWDCYNDAPREMRKDEEEAYNYILNIVTPPTQEEVVIKLNEYYKDIGGFKIEYDKSKMCFYDIKGGDVIARFNTVLVTIFKSLPPRLTTLIGRFYEGVAR